MNAQSSDFLDLTFSADPPPLQRQEPPLELSRLGLFREYTQSQLEEFQDLISPEPPPLQRREEFQDLISHEPPPLIRQEQSEDVLIFGGDVQFQN